MIDVLLKSCNNFSGIKPWFSTSIENASTNPQLKNGDKGLIPASFIPSMQTQKPKSKNLITELLTIFQTHMVAKWKLHTYVNLKQIKTLDDVKSNLRFLQAIEITL